MRVSYTRQLGDLYERWESETTLDNEDVGLTVDILRRITHPPETVKATTFDGESVEIPIE